MEKTIAQQEIDKAIAQGKIARTELDKAQSKFDTVVKQYVSAKELSAKAQGKVDSAMAQRKIVRSELEAKSRPLASCKVPINPIALNDSKDIHVGQDAILSERPQQALRQLLADYGPVLLKESWRVSALLADLCGEYRRERFLLVHALRERIPAELSERPQIGMNGVVHELGLAQRFRENHGFSAEAAQWAIENWSLALDVTWPAQRQKATELVAAKAEACQNKKELDAAKNIASRKKKELEAVQVLCHQRKKELVDAQRVAHQNADEWNAAQNDG